MLGPAVAVGIAGQPVAATWTEAKESLFVTADANADGLLDESEVAADLIRAFVDLDADRDEVLDAGELAGVDPARLRKVDSNGDGRVSFAEAMSRKMIEFASADADADGVVTLDELLSFEWRRR